MTRGENMNAAGKQSYRGSHFLISAPGREKIHILV